jgi:hypothetical protein
MPQFYATDNLTTWAFTNFTEFYEGLGDSEEDVQMKKRLRGLITTDPIDDLKDDIDEQFAVALKYENQTLKEAIMNSIDWNDLVLKLKDWEEDLE